MFLGTPPVRAPADNQTVFRVRFLTWARDGKSVVFNSLTAVFVSHLWRGDVDGETRGASRARWKRRDHAGHGVINDCLAFTRLSYDLDVYLFQAGRPVRSEERTHVARTGLNLRL
jgi:hypothetical protein